MRFFFGDHQGVTLVHHNIITSKVSSVSCLGFRLYHNTITSKVSGTLAHAGISRLGSFLRVDRIFLEKHHILPRKYVSLVPLKSLCSPSFNFNFLNIRIHRI